MRQKKKLNREIWQESSKIWLAAVVGGVVVFGLLYRMFGNPSLCGSGYCPF